MAVLESKAVQALTKLGFKEYQAKVYCALVALGQASATEVHKLSGVPRPRVYDTLNELVKIGAVNFHRGRPVIYKAVDPSAVVDWSRRIYLAAGDEAIRQLEKTSIQQTETGLDLIWVLRGDENIKNRVKQMLNQAKKEVFVRFFAPDRYSDFVNQFREAKARRVILKSLVFEHEEAMIRRIDGIFQMADFRRIDPTMPDKAGVVPLMKDILVSGPKRGGTDLGIIMTDMRQSMFVLGNKMGYKLGVWIGIPIVVMIQRTLFEYIWQNSKMIEIR